MAERALFARDRSSTNPAQPSYLARAAADLTKSQIIGLGLGIAAGTIIIGVAIFFLLRWLKQRKENKIPDKLVLRSVEENINTLSMEEDGGMYRKSSRYSLPMMFRKYYARRTFRVEPRGDSSKILI
ncbi:hypothetical protein GGI12_001771 [Dipsacomyces acuminosporus]|nr:hypothetical protein GGI12_001771 [Dipsacomyces acuminosporus]